MRPPAAEKGSLEALETLRGWAEEVELHPAHLLLAPKKCGETTFNMAAQENHVQMLQ